MLTEVEKAYIAGIFDGEGHVSIYVQRQKTMRFGYNIKLRVGITNSFLPLLKWIQSEFGGQIWKKKNIRRQCYNLELVSSKAEDFLWVVIPFLRIKKEQALLGLELRKTYKTIKYTQGINVKIIEKRMEIKEKIEYLNKGVIGECLENVVERKENESTLLS